MGVHLYFFVIFSIFALFFGINANSEKKTIFLFIAFGLILFERSFVDPDSLPDLNSYHQIFVDISNIDLLQPQAISNYQYSQKAEAGFLIFLKIASFVTSDFNLVLLIYALIWLMIFSYIIAKYSSNLFLSFVLLFLLIYGQSLFVIRQHMAIPIILLTYDAIINRKIYWFIILVLIASQFHTTAIIWLPMYFCYASNKPYYLAAVIVAVIFGLSYAISNIDFINSRMILDYSSYINQGGFQESNNIPLLIGAFYGICYCICLQKTVLADGLNRLLLISIFVDVVLFAVSNTFVMVTRLALYFHIAIIFIVPLICKAIKDPIINTILIVFTITLFTYIQFMGSFFVNIQKMKMVSLSTEHVICYIVALLVFYAFYYIKLKPYLEYNRKKTRNYIR